MTTLRVSPLLLIGSRLTMILLMGSKLTTCITCIIHFLINRDQLNIVLILLAVLFINTFSWIEE